MPFSESQKKALRGLGHKLKPVVTIGSAGLTESVIEEFNRSIAHHELMKVKVNAGDRDQRDAILQRLHQLSAAELVQRIGNTGLFIKLKKKNSRFGDLPD